MVDNASFNCKLCLKKVCLDLGKPCDKVEAYLKSLGIFSADWIRPMRDSRKRADGKGSFLEIPFSSLSPQGRRKAGIE